MTESQVWLIVVATTYICCSIFMGMVFVAKCKAEERWSSFRTDEAAVVVLFWPIIIVILAATSVWKLPMYVLSKATDVMAEWSRK